MKIAIVEWDDAYSNGGWHTPNPDLDRIARCISMGLLCYEDDKQITIAQSYSMTSGNIGDTITIPKGCIKRIRQLQIKEVGNASKE